MNNSEKKTNLKFYVGGMTCSACSARVDKVVAAVEGADDVSVNLLKHSMTLNIDESKTSVKEIVDTVKKAGYDARLLEKDGVSITVDANGSTEDQYKKGIEEIEKMENEEIDSMRRRLIISAIFTIPLFYISMGHMMGWPLPKIFIEAEYSHIFAMVQIALLIPIVFVNRRFFINGIKNLFKRNPNMDSLIAIGSGASIVYGIYAIVKILIAMKNDDMQAVHRFAMDLYFESAGMILTLITLGKFFEARAKRKTSSSIRKLMDLTPKTARKVGENSKFDPSKIQVDIPIENLKVGDLILVKAGESIASDGVVVDGFGSVDESLITGESVPVEKFRGSKVIGGSINKSGAFTVRIEKVGSETALSKIIKLVDDATSSKAPIEKIADKVSSIFVPTVIGIGIVTFAVWLSIGKGLEFSLSMAISVLVISCPCALGLATPTAIMVGTGRGVADGILIKSAEALEVSYKVNTVVLDKTGTITEGKPRVTDIGILESINRDKFISLAYSIEGKSEHPIGQGIVEFGKANNGNLLEIDEFRQIPGRGIEAVIQNSKCLAGNFKFMEESGIKGNLNDALKLGNDFAMVGKTPIYFSANGLLVGVIAVADTVKSTSIEAISEMQQENIKVVMLTGDNEKTAKYIGNKVGVDEIISEVLPEDKESIVAGLRSNQNLVAMVGDGINDAPALARADVGIAIGAGTDVAMEAADVVLMKSDLRDILITFDLSKKVIRNIKQNLFWAFIYNVIGIPIAAGVFYSLFSLRLNPMIAATAMGFSSICVVSNALRLRFFTGNKKEIRGRNAEDAADVQFYTIEEVDIIKDNIEEPTKTGSNDIAEVNKKMKREIEVGGMTCQHCVAHVKKAVEAVDGVEDVKVTLDDGLVEVEHDGTVTDEAITKAITDDGYEVLNIK